MKKVMMTVFKIVLILIAVVVVGVVALILFALHKESNYYKYTEAVGEIEQKYTAFGDKEVSCQEYDANDKVYGTAQFICCSKDMKRHPKHLWARMPNFFQYALSGCRTGCRKELVCA